MTIEAYHAGLRDVWDNAVKNSRNGLFQHLRAYMDYHADRFSDCSVLARDAKGRVIAVLPAHASGNTVCSHRGLSFGGWLMGDRADMPAMMEVWDAASEHYRNNGFKELVYRPVPHIYHRYPAEEDLYALFRAGGRLEASQVSSVIDLACPLTFDSNARRAESRARRLGVECGPSDDYAQFWQILTRLLVAKYNTRPVHTLAEIELLVSRFPDNIRLYTATEGSEILAGVVMYYSGPVAHCQYISTSERGRENGALPALMRHLIEIAVAGGYRYFDFGISCEDGGRYLNQGLIRQKCGFGARAVVFTSYIVTL